MKLGYLVSEYPAVSHTFILREVRCLRERGIQIATASINPSNAIGENEEIAHTYYIKKAGALGAFGAFFLVLLRRPVSFFKGLAFALKCGREGKLIVLYFFYFIEALLVGRWLIHQGASHLHVHFANPAASVGMIVRKIFPVTFSITVHGPDVFENPVRHRLAEKMEVADFIICISAFAKSQLMKVTPIDKWKKLYIVHLGVDPAEFREAEFRTAPFPFKILNVGRLVRAKGQAYLIRALGNLSKEGRDFHLRIIGDGPEKEKLVKEAESCGIADKVKFEGAVSEWTARESYAEADLFASSSLAEGLPVVLMEAMASKVACVATEIAGIPEIIRSGENGILVPSGEVGPLQNAIAKLMDDPKMRRSLAEKGREILCRDYNLEENVEKLAEVFYKECR